MGLAVDFVALGTAVVAVFIIKYESLKSDKSFRALSIANAIMMVLRDLMHKLLSLTSCAHVKF